MPQRAPPPESQHRNRCSAGGETDTERSAKKTDGDKKTTLNGSETATTKEILKMDSELVESHPSLSPEINRQIHR